MAEAETLAALKRAYADTIMNTTKEAAARVMVSEKRARRYQQELVTVREEAIHTLLRLKHMCDSKVAETEMISLKQQQKIEELEAQLEEAEDIVGELRTELRELHNMIKKLTNGQTHLKSDNEEDSCPKNSDAAVSVVPEVSCIPVEQSGTVVANSIKNPSLARIDCLKRCSSKDNMDTCLYTRPSILTKRREVESCARMILTVDRSVANGDSPSSGESQDVNDGEALVKPDASDSILSARDSEDPIVSIGSSQKDVGAPVSTLIKCKEAEECTQTIFSVDGSMASEDLSSSVEVRDVNDGETLAITSCVSSARDRENSMVSPDSSQKDVGAPVSLKTSSKENGNERKSAIGETEARKEEKESSDSVEVSASPLCEVAPVSAVNKKHCIKYTFQRKRKKEAISNPEGDTRSRNVKQKTEDNYLESLQPSFMDSPRDSLCVAEVARQVVPFTEKKGLQAELVNQ